MNSCRGTQEVTKRICGQVVSHTRKGELVWLTLEVAGWRSAAPGQFVMLQREFSTSFLPRPFSVAAEEFRGEGTARLSFLIAPVGEATHELARSQPGDKVLVLGPLGRGFDLRGIFGAQPTHSKLRLVLVGGGVGVAPFPHLLQVLARGEFGVGGPVSGRDLLEVVGLLGFRDGAQAAAAQPVEAGFAALREAGINCRLLLATEDGSVGNRGLVTDLLAEHLEAGDCLLVCGPWAMAERVWTLAKTKSGVRTWFSLETGMACGVGSCHGCVIELADGSLARVCHEGPVFPGEIVFGGRSGND